VIVLLLMMISIHMNHAIYLVMMMMMKMMMKDSGSDKIRLLVMKNQECVSLVMIVQYVVYWMMTKTKLKIVQIVLMLIGITSILINAIQLMKDSGSNKTTTSFFKAMNVNKLVTQIILQMMKLLPNA